MADWEQMYHEAEAERDALQVAMERLVKTSTDLLREDMPTGNEPAGQSMDITMRQHRIREWRKAVINGVRALGLGGEGEGEQR